MNAAPHTLARVGLVIALCAAPLALSGCSKILDGSRHLGGGDGGVDDDGGLTDPCAAAPTARCGAPVDDECPPIAQTHLASILEGEPLGQLRPTIVLENADGIAPEFAMATVEQQGELHGTAVLLAIQARDGGTDRPVRLDVPLHDLLAPAFGSLRVGTDDLAESGSATSVSLAREFEGGPVVGLGIMNSAAGEYWGGYTNLVTAETALDEQTTTDGYLDVLGAAPGFLVRRTLEDDAVVRLNAVYNFSQGVMTFLNTSTSGVPEGDWIRVLGARGDYSLSDGNFVAFQDGQGSFWTWPLRAPMMGTLTDPVAEARAGQTGKAAWVQTGASDYLLVFHVAGTVHFQPFTCTVECLYSPFPGSPPTVSTIAPTGEVPSAVALPDGRVATLITERYADGDRMVLQVIDASLQSFTLPRVEILDLRASGERVTDAEIHYVETPQASTLAIAAAIGASTESASRIVMTGLRSCAE
jgi:hypothetical protein